ncbi:hypothetical protein I4F81_005905 [Pyropia yezoensis]|uniref:Uncharacterized protein n=1 Tax=Pyropia yezoensis TaxID=2788 RepID=A0ACC3BZL3_PYRYE|nr:hypothetical protein I4F81_005905 [Neopyropia yezoensis]
MACLPPPAVAVVRGRGPRTIRNRRLAVARCGSTAASATTASATTADSDSGDGGGGGGGDGGGDDDGGDGALYPRGTSRPLAKPLVFLSPDLHDRLVAAVARVPPGPTVLTASKLASSILDACRATRRCGCLPTTSTAVRAADFEAFTGTGEAAFLTGVAELYGVPDWDAAVAKARFFDIYLHRGYVARLTPFRGVAGLLGRLRELGLTIAVASSADAVKVTANLDAIGLGTAAFDATTSGEEVVRKKPDPAVFFKAAEKVGAAPSRCVVVEDAVAGVVAAKAVGMRCVGVSTSMPAAAFTEAGADVVPAEVSGVSLQDLFGGDLVWGDGQDGKGARTATEAATAGEGSDSGEEDAGENASS